MACRFHAALLSLLGKKTPPVVGGVNEVNGGSVWISRHPRSRLCGRVWRQNKMACGFHTISLNKEVVGSVDLWVYAASFGFGEESSTLQCPTDSVRNLVIPPEWHQNPQEWHQNCLIPPEWHRNGTGMGQFRQNSTGIRHKGLKGSPGTNLIHSIWYRKHIFYIYYTYIQFKLIYTN